LVRDSWRRGKKRGGNIFNLTCLVQFLEEERREEEGSIPLFASPKLEFFGMVGR
jgi:hypothetical protein